MTNKQLRQYLAEFPDDMEVLLDRNGCIYTDVERPVKRFFGTKQRECIALLSSIKYPI